MTVRDLYDAALIEINKLEAPSMLLEDYNYFINKAIQQYINKVYNRYEINQQATDDLLALRSSVSPEISALEKDYVAMLPNNYWHILNCVIEFEKNGNNTGCKSSTDPILMPARKLTADQYPAIINNAYFKPSYRSPYYTVSEEINGGNIIDMIIDPCHTENDKNIRYKMNIKCGNDKKYTPKYAYVEYLRTPTKVMLNEEDLYGVDETDEMEFSDYVCYEIINEFVKLLLENTADPRLSTNVPINQTVIPQITE